MLLEFFLQYVDGLLNVSGHPDYPNALNGLQVGRSPDRPIRRLAASVDVSEAVIRDAIENEADVLVVHHGLFWSGLQPLTGRRYRKVRALIEADLALYAVHLPLDAHPELGNCARLLRALDLEPAGRFGAYEGVEIGWWCDAGGLSREDLRDRLSRAVGGPVSLIAGGPDGVERVAVLTGGGGSFVGAAASAGMDALITGEGAHHTFVEAHELGLNVYYAGHYATETFGVAALCAHLAERFELEWVFLDHPSGL